MYGEISCKNFDGGGELLAAIAKGEVALVLLPDEQRAWAIEYLRSESQRLANSGEIKHLSLAEALSDIADSLARAAAREEE